MAESQLSKTADLRDEHGNPIQLTDEHGNPVQLTDEYGHPMHLTGVAAAVTGVGVPGGPAEIEVPASGPVEVASSEPALKHGDVPPETGGIMGSPEGDHRKVDRSGSSSSSSSSEEEEDDGQGGRRKKKGLKEKIKEKLTGGKHREGKLEEHVSQPSTHTSETPPPPLGEEHLQHHEKKSVMEKIKEKLPGHHTHS